MNQEDLKMLHLLRIESNYFSNLDTGSKKCEIRYNDRDYQLGDVLQFRINGGCKEDLQFKITHIHSGLGMKEGYVVLSLEEVNGT